MEDANDPMSNEIISACADKKIKKLMGFKHDRNKEVIAQFYATVYFGYIDGDRAMFWMTEGTLYRITYPRFARLFGFGTNDANHPKLHLQPPLPVEEMRFMYPRDQVHNAGKVAGLYTYYSILNQLLRKTITPRGGNPADISLHARKLLATLRLGGPVFCVADFIWEEIMYI